MPARPILLFLSITVHVAATAQPCDCAATFDWMVATFAENDAGHGAVVERKGAAEYAKHTERLREKAQAASTVDACQPVLHDWLMFFRKGHIGIGRTELAMERAQALQRSAAAGTAAWPTVDLTEKQLIAELSAKGRERHALEGVWEGETYRLGILRDRTHPGSYRAFVLASKNPAWRPREVKVDIRTAVDGRHFDCVFYMGDRSERPVRASLVGEGTLDMLGYMARVYPAHVPSPAESLLVRAATAEAPFLERLSDRTLYLRIPSFQFEHKAAIDALLQEHDATLRATENLIVDIRNGTGGSDASYEGLMPYLCSGVMRSVDVEFRATALNTKAFEDYAVQFADNIAMAEACRETAARLRVAHGGFVPRTDLRVQVDSACVATPMPRRVGILCNEGNGSSDEQFLMDARQSAKVKLFGRPTMGVLDVSNMNFATSPDGLFSMGYAMSRSYRIPGFPIDDIGIQPDVFFDDGIPYVEWVMQVREMLER